MNEVAGLLSFLCLLGSVGWYYPLIIRRRVHPAPATWIVGCFAINLAMISYNAIPGRTMIENVTLYGAALHVNFFLVLIMVTEWRSGNLKIAFDWLQKSCIVAMVAALLYWFFNKDKPYVTFWTTQVLIVVAYTATIAKAFQLRTAFDSVGNMGLIFACSVMGAIPAVMMASPYGITNSVRAVVASGITLSVLVYYDKKNRNSRWKDEVETIKSFYRWH